MFFEGDEYIFWDEFEVIVEKKVYVFGVGLSFEKVLKEFDFLDGILIVVDGVIFVFFENDFVFDIIVIDFDGRILDLRIVNDRGFFMVVYVYGDNVDKMMLYVLFFFRVFGMI